MPPSAALHVALARARALGSSRAHRNLSEGQRSGGGNQRRHDEIAHGSANEVKGALAVAEAWGWIEQPARACATLERLLVLLWRLTHPRH